MEDSLVDLVVQMVREYARACDAKLDSEITQINERARDSRLLQRSCRRQCVQKDDHAGEDSRYMRREADLRSGFLSQLVSAPSVETESNLSTRHGAGPVRMASARRPPRAMSAAPGLNVRGG